VKCEPTTSRLCAALIAALFIVFAAGTPVFGQASTTTNETIPFTSTLLNPCTLDQVTFQGNMHVTNTMSTDASGGTHLKTHVNYQDVSGTGTPSGVNYNIRTTSNETTNDNDGPQSEATIISTVRLISQGSSLNYFLQLVFHVTVNGNGETTSTVTESRIECRGSN
jgi:hypothetical protein